MTNQRQLTKGQRLAGVLDHLGIKKVHVATAGFASSWSDLAALLRERPDIVASLTLLSPPRQDLELARPYAEQIVCLAGEDLAPDEVRNLQAMSGWTGVTVVQYPAGYSPVLWSDIVHDQSQVLVDTLAQQRVKWGSLPVELDDHDSELEEVTYRVKGTGPPLLMLPLGLAPSQWNEAIDALSQDFTTIRLGGIHLGTAQSLEQRAWTGTYIDGVRSMCDMLHIEPGNRVLEVGTGQGTLARDLAIRVPSLAEVVGVDVNEYMLGEAQNFARKAPLASPLRYQHGDASALPFEDESFDAAFSVTVFEECDADKAIAEMNRVLKPGGRAGVITRSADLPWYWNVNVPAEIQAKLNAPSTSEPVSAGGCVDASLYSRFAAAFAGVIPKPYWNCVPEPSMPQIQRGKLRLSSDELQLLESAIDSGHAAGTFFAAMPFHCVVGAKSV